MTMLTLTRPFATLSEYSPLALVLEWQARARSRQALAGLDARLLEDIGLAHREAESEAAKPFWLA